MRLTRRATRDQLTKQGNEDLPEGISGTITGGPMEPFNLLEIMERGARGASRGAAVSGAAQVVADNVGCSYLAARGIALSDGSMICFASIAEAGLRHDDHRPVAGDSPRPAAKAIRSPVPNDRKPRVKVHRARVLVSL
jgi:hypothetical protein